MKTCCFTGHRKIDLDDLDIAGIGNFLIDLVKRGGVTDFYAGGALGWDMLCEKMILHLKKRFPQIRLHLILPCPPEIQTDKWNISQIDQYQKIMRSADNVEILSETYYDGCMKKRNQRLVELADVCVCYCTTPRSGTGQTVRMAQKRNLTVVNIATEKK